MSENKTFQLALLVSVLIHSVFFWSISYTPFAPSKRSLNKLKITYYKIKETPKKERIIRRKRGAIIEKLPEIKKEEILKPPGPPSKEIKKGKKEIGRITVDEKVKEKKFEKVVEEEKDDTKRATYISYYRAVRERIKQYAYRNYLRNRNPREGEILLSFVVASSGELLQIKIIDEKSTDDLLLRNIALNSIRDASPFPPFPSGMSQYQITFNVIISFELHR